MRIQAQNGRQFDVRATADGRGIQVGIVSTRGNIIEAAIVDGPQELIAALQQAEQEGLDRLFESQPSWLDRIDEAQAAIPKSPTHCPEGHRLTKNSTYSNDDGTRGCKECRGLRNNWYRKSLGLAPLAPHERPEKPWKYWP